MAATDPSTPVDTGRLELPAPDAVITRFWVAIDPKHQLFNGQMSDRLDIAPYLEYYKRQWNAIAADADGRYVTVRSHDDIVEIIELLKNGEPKESVIQYLTRNSATTADRGACESSLNLAARVLVMLKIGVVKNQAVPRRCLLWETGSLADFIEESFRGPPALVFQGEKMPRNFNAWSIDVVGGIRIEFTDNLHDHLLLLDDDTKVLRFHHASFLECQIRTLLPEDLVEETLRTLALLFPQSEFRKGQWWKKGKRDWFTKLSKDSRPLFVDPRVIQCGNLNTEARQIEGFKYWRDRLIILKQAYDQATPSTVSQWWHDRRNGERWYTFWVAMLVLVITTTLGVVQCVESGLQVYKAYHPS
ncbi:hypothetical protein SLS62_009394 [Diatrype stigma]|uniref:Uncharacterized protein n=1 Tax=Diatrype stigma TaxID=117547 RepID=A0AAN9UES1_9PEZI